MITKNYCPSKDPDRRYCAKYDAAEYARSGIGWCIWDKIELNWVRWYFEEADAMRGAREMDAEQN